MVGRQGHRNEESIVELPTSTVAGRGKAGDRPWGAVYEPQKGERSRRANRPFDSNPTSVEESAAGEEQHHKDDDEQSGRVHFFSCLFSERGPASSRPVNARDERRRFGAATVRIPLTPNVG